MKRTIFPYDFSPYYPIGIQPCPCMWMRQIVFMTE